MHDLPIAVTLFGYVGIALPLIVYASGIAIALNRWNRRPKVSLFALGGLSLFFLNGLIMSVGIAIAVSIVKSPEQRNIMIPVIASTVGVIFAVAFSLLIAAIFADRSAKSHEV